MTLLEFQRRMASAIMAPLAAGDRIATRAQDGRPMRLHAAEFIKPNLRLRSVDRLEIYARSYWYRVIDSMYEDYPGLRAILGQRRFNRLVRAYLADCPSHSFSLRDLGSRLSIWLRRNPEQTGKKARIALDMALLEWAHIEAWDAETARVLDSEDLLELGPNLRIGLQPYVRLLHLRHPVDDVRIHTNATEDHEQASNAPTKRCDRWANRLVGTSKRQNIFLAVHRLDSSVYYKRLAADEYRILRALRDGRSIGEALQVACAGKSSAWQEDFASRVEGLFALWAKVGWLCQSLETKDGRPSGI